jgi:hypothetical protein
MCFCLWSHPPSKILDPPLIRSEIIWWYN